MDKRKLREKKLPRRIPKNPAPLTSDPAQDPNFVPMFGPSGSLIDTELRGIGKRRATPIWNSNPLVDEFRHLPLPYEAANNENADGEFPEPEILRRGESSNLQTSAPFFASTPPQVTRTKTRAPPLVSTPIDEAGFSLVLSAIEEPDTPDGTLACFEQRLAAYYESDNSSFSTIEEHTAGLASQDGGAIVEDIKLSKPAITDASSEQRSLVEASGSHPPTAEEQVVSGSTQEAELSDGNEVNSNEGAKPLEGIRSTGNGYKGFRFNPAELHRERMLQKKRDASAGIAVAATRGASGNAGGSSETAEDSFEEYLRKASGLLSGTRRSPIKSESPVRPEKRSSLKRTMATATDVASSVADPEDCLSPYFYHRSACTLLTLKRSPSRSEQPANCVSSPKKIVKKFKLVD